MSTTIDKPFEIATHNGYVSATSVRTGEHRTFKIWTQKDEAKFAPGERIVGLLSGPDNESDYRAFGFVVDGEVRLFRKHLGQPFYQWAALFLAHPERMEGKVEITFEERCRKCNRHLTDPLSVTLGIGPVCRGDE
jgi:hypothetical protein